MSIAFWVFEEGKECIISLFFIKKIGIPQQRRWTLYIGDRGRTPLQLSRRCLKTPVSQMCQEEQEGYMTHTLWFSRTEHSTALRRGEPSMGVSYSSWKYSRSVCEPLRHASLGILESMAMRVTSLTRDRLGSTEVPAVICHFSNRSLILID